MAELGLSFKWASERKKKRESDVMFRTNILLKLLKERLLITLREPCQNIPVSWDLIKFRQSRSHDPLNDI